MKHSIIRIDRKKCTGCGSCVPDCPAGALRIVNGKAELKEGGLCDGLGACIGKCPSGALTLEKIEKPSVSEADPADVSSRRRCPGSDTENAGIPGTSGGQWPVQLKLIAPGAGCFDGTKLLIAADCVPVVWEGFHKKYPEKRGMALFCPKLDRSSDEYVRKLSEIMINNPIQEVDVLRMQVPCCGGATAVASRAVTASGKKDIDIREIVICLDGSILEERTV